PGIGRKTAERLILELKDKLDLQKMEGLELQAVPKTAMSEEALLALVSLGYNRGQAEKVIVQLLSSAEFQDVESLIKQALQRL
ncbi:MAG: Holliday junction branch migration protein RuvA, partial [Calditrichaeota bacterium]